jgi:hypothetical protein
VNAASLHRSTPLPVAASPVTVVGGGGAITPAAGQGFIPASAAAAAKAGQGTAPAGQAGAAQAPPTAEQVLASIMQELGPEFFDPIVAADGTIYVQRKTLDSSTGQRALSYFVAGKIDKATGKLMPSDAMMKLVDAKQKDGGEAKRVLVKVGDQWVWQTFGKDEAGKPIVTDMAVASEQEVAAYQQQQQAAAAKQAAQAGLQDNADWQRKLGTVAGSMGLFGSTGQFLNALSAGPHPLTGKSRSGWLQGWFLATRLNGQAQGKLLPSWVTSGPAATALEFGLQAYGMLDVPNDVRILRDFFAGKSLPAVNPNAMQQLVAAGQHPATASALTQLGGELREGTMRMVEGTENAALLNTKLGAAQLVTRADLHAAYNATDPVQSSGLKLKGNIDTGITKGLGLLSKLIQPAMMGASALNLVSSVIGIKNTVATQGAKILVDNQQGRGMAVGALNSAVFLGMYLIPMAMKGLGALDPTIAAASSALNIAQNVIGGVQMLNSHGLFGGEGILNKDAVRAAFLIPPLTPLGAFAFWMKSRKKKQDDEAAKLEAAKKLAVERITQQREMAKLQLQSTGQIAGAVQGPDGSILVPTNVPNDLSQLAAQLSAGSTGAPASAAAAPAAGSSGENAALADQRRQLTMTARPMR